MLYNNGSVFSKNIPSFGGSGTAVQGGWQAPVPGTYQATQGANYGATPGASQVVQGANFGATPGASQVVQGALTPQQSLSQSQAIDAMIKSGQYGHGDTAFLNASRAFGAQQQQQSGNGFTVNPWTGMDSPDYVSKNSPYTSPNTAKRVEIPGTTPGAGNAGAGAGTGTSFGNSSQGPYYGNMGTAASGMSPGGDPSSITPITSYPNPANTGYQAPNGGTYFPQNSAVNMQQTSPQSAVQDYQNTAGNQLLGSGAGQYYQQSPGYQFAVNDALNQVQGMGAARGLLGSGSLMRSMTDRAQGMASQDYNNWWNQQHTLFSDYQNRLAGLAGGDTGAANAMNTGTNLGQTSLQTGGNLGSLFANQGNAGLSGIANTGAAQSNNITQAGNTTAQINAANQATQLAGAVATQPQRTGLF